MPIATLLNAEDLYSLPESRQHCELWHGELRPMTPAGGAHGWVIKELIWPLNGHVRSRDLGALFFAETGIVLQRGPDTVLCPDIAFVAKSRLPPDGIGWGFLELVPDMVVEVLSAGAPAIAGTPGRSPSDRAGQVRHKVAFYLQRGVRAVWVIDPRRRTIRVHTADGERLFVEADDLEGGDVLPGFRLPISALFAGLQR
jgi:Uma2 family endonuclease